MSEPVPSNSPQPLQQAENVSNAGEAPLPQPAPPQGAPAASESTQPTSQVPTPGDGGGEVAASSTASQNDAREDAVDPPAAGGEPGTPAGAVKEGGSQPRSAKRSRDAPIPVGLPKNMVRRIMKLGEETRNISNEALIIVVKASELFLERFAAQSFEHAEKLGRKTIKYRDVSDVRSADPNLLFLEAVVPP